MTNGFLQGNCSRQGQLVVATQDHRLSAAGVMPDKKSGK